MPRVHQTAAVPYVIETAAGVELSRHRTRQGAADTWRTRHTGLDVRIYREDAKGVRTLVVEGIWHEAKRP